MSGKTHLAYLDGLRGIAICAVVLVHVSKVFGGLPLSLGNAATYGAKFVGLFFVVSGFTMGVQYLGKPFDSRSFAIRRFFRVAPMFYLAAIVYGLIGMLPKVPFSGAEGHAFSVVVTTLFVHGWFPRSINTVVPGGWSIAAEMMFYLSFPLLLPIFSRPALRTKTGAAMILTASLLLAATSIFIIPRIIGPAVAGKSNFAFYFWVTQLPAFVGGLAASQIVGRFNAKQGNWMFYGSAAAILTLAIFKGPASNFLIADVLFVLLVLGAAVSRPVSLEGRSLSLIGITSYSIYIVHFAVIDAVWAVFPPDQRYGLRNFLLAYAGVLAVSLAISCVTYRTIETPFINLSRRISTPKRAVVVPAA